MKSIMRCGFVLALASLSACAAQVSAPGGAPVPIEVQPAYTADRGDAILAVASTAASIADALAVAPPATITSRTTIDERAVRLAFRTFEAALIVIDGFRDSGQLPYNSPAARRVKDGILKTRAGLNAASSAQRAGQANTYRQALTDAQVALSGIRAAIAQ